MINPSKLKIALDVEGVLANIHSAWITIYNKQFVKEDIKKWFFEDLPGENLKSFLKESNRIWTNHWEAIPPLEPEFSHLTQELNKFGKVDIVTGRNLEEPVKNWLKHNKIIYTDYYYENNKTQLNYDIFIDDNPLMIETLKPDQFWYIYDQPFNRNHDFEKNSNIKRVNSLKMVVDDLHIKKKNLK